MSVAVLLAAGYSRRTTIQKPLYPVGGRPLIERQAERLAAYGYRVGAVLGYRAEAVAAALEHPCEIVVNEAYDEGMMSSVRAACRAWPGENLLLCHVDRPVPAREVFAALERAGSPLAVCRYRGERAPPIFLGAELSGALLASDATRLDAWVLSRPELRYVEVRDPRVSMNANDDEKLRSYFD